MKAVVVIILLSSFAGLFAFKNFRDADTTQAVTHTLDYFKYQSSKFASATTNLKEKINSINDRIIIPG